jgi:heptaprenyl diphosphate synthase component 2
MADLFAAGGKRVRPALVLLTARIGTYDLERLKPAAMAVELVHAATLVHDDVIDRSPTRRGRPSVAAALGDEPAIVVGDYYFAKAYEQAARSKSPEVVAILANAVMRICAGEVRQQSIRYRYSTGVDEYMGRIEAKTATLLAACCDIGALLSGWPDARRDQAREYGRLLGLAFQIADDVLDYVGSEDETGKPSGHDLAEGFAMREPRFAVSVGHVLVDGRALSADEAARMAARVRASGAPGVAIERARALAAEAAAKLEGLGPGKQPLVALADYVVSRKF